jgi:hypothetical protein
MVFHCGCQPGCFSITCMHGLFRTLFDIVTWDFRFKTLRLDFAYFYQLDYTPMLFTVHFFPTPQWMDTNFGLLCGVCWCYICCCSTIISVCGHIWCSCDPKLSGQLMSPTTIGALGLPIGSQHYISLYLYTWILPVIGCSVSVAFPAVHGFTRFLGTWD